MHFKSIRLALCAAAIIGAPSAAAASEAAPSGIVSTTPANMPTTPATDAATRQRAEDLCAARDGEACATLGALYRDGRGVTPTRTMALTYFRRSCSLGHQPGCEAATTLVATPAIEAAYTYTPSPSSVSTAPLQRTVPPEGINITVERRHARLARRGILPTLLLGPRVEVATTTQTYNEQQIVDLLDPSCRSGNQRSCAALGFLLVKTTSSRQDITRGTQLLDQACTSADALACRVKETMLPTIVDVSTLSSDERRAARRRERNRNHNNILNHGDFGAAIVAAAEEENLPS